jgi:hypothetical protein
MMSGKNTFLINICSVFTRMHNQSNTLNENNKIYFLLKKIYGQPEGLIIWNFRRKKTLQNNTEPNNAIVLSHQFYRDFVETITPYTPKNISIKSTVNKIQYSTQQILVLNQYFKKGLKFKSILVLF